MATVAFKIVGMDCAEEVAALKAELAPLSGIRTLAFDVLNGKMTVEFSEPGITSDDLVAAVAKAGLKALPWEETEQSASQSTAWTRWGRTALTTASGMLLLVGLIVQVSLGGWRAAVLGEDGQSTPMAARLLYLGAVVTGSWFVAPKAWRSLLRFRPDMNLLMTVAVAGAMVIDEFFEAATVAFLFALSITLEAWSVGRARRAIAALLALTPTQALVLKMGGTNADQRNPSGVDQDKQAQEQLLEISVVPVGSTVLVKPGQKFPLDGKITKGETSVNQAPITGESKPVVKSVGNDVFAGTINEDGTVEFITTKRASETTVAKIVKMVGDAQSKRSPSEQWVEKFARYYTPAVMALAISVMVLPPLLIDGAWPKWFYEGLVLLVIACPCALVISTPVSIVAALAAAAKNGVLIKGGLYVEAPAHLRAIAMDKTGTLTEGRPAVREVVSLSGHDQKELMEIAAAIEARSEHPLARAVLSHAQSLGIHAKAAENFQVVKGKGASATLNGKPVWIGSHRFLEERGQETPEMHDKLQLWSSSGSSALVIGNDEHVCGFIAVADGVRQNAKRAVSDLKAAGIEHVIMLTGDNRGTADAVARETGVDEVKAELLPEEKVKAVEELVHRYGQVAMIGDGVNDAPAMARATLGIAMGAVGTDVAIETSDIALMSDDLSRLAWLIWHSKRTLSIIRQNIIASLGVKALFVILTLIGHGSLWAAIAADTGMSLLVVFNALRLLGQRE
jgi:Cd2+/Zn2+-exporting ATPase